MAQKSPPFDYEKGWTAQGQGFARFIYAQAKAQKGLGLMAKRTYTTIVFHPEDNRPTVKFNQPKPTLETMQAAVKGLIEPVDYQLKKQVNQHIVAYCNEEFAYLNMAPNWIGTRAVKWHHMIYGPIWVHFTSTNTKARDYFIDGFFTDKPLNTEAATT